MPESAPTPKFIIRYKGILDLEGLYRVMVQWLKARRYWFHETTYKHKVPSPFGAEEEIRFRAERKCSDYYKHEIMIYMHIWDQQTVEVIKEGKKQKLIKAKVEIKINPTLVVDWQGRYENSPFMKKLRAFLHRYVIKEQIETLWWDELHYRTVKLQAMIKDYLDSQTKSHAYEGYLGDNR